MRLTKKTQYGYEDIDECVITSCSDKLGQLEDIEEELGIDLITLFNKSKIIKEEHLTNITYHIIIKKEGN